MSSADSAVLPLLTVWKDSFWSITQLAKKIHKDLLDEEKRSGVSGYSKHILCQCVAFMNGFMFTHTGKIQYRSFYVCVYDKARDLCGAHLRKVLPLFFSILLVISVCGHRCMNVLKCLQGQTGWKEKAEKWAYGGQYEQGRPYLLPFLYLMLQRKNFLINCIQLRLSISHSLNEAIGEKDEEDADVDVASLTRLQVSLLHMFAFFHVDCACSVSLGPLWFCAT